MRRSSRGGDDCSLIKDNLFAICTVAALRHDHRHYRISDLDTGRYPFADMIDNPLARKMPSKVKERDVVLSSKKVAGSAEDGRPTEMFDNPLASGGRKAGGAQKGEEGGDEARPEARLEARPEG